MIGTSVTGIAVSLRERVRCGTMPIDQAESAIEMFLPPLPVRGGPESFFDRLNAQEPGRRDPVSVPSLSYSPAQEAFMPADFVRRVGPILDRRADEIRTRPTFVLDGIRADWIANAMQEDWIQAQVCLLSAVWGTSVRVRPEDRPAQMVPLTNHDLRGGPATPETIRHPRRPVSEASRAELETRQQRHSLDFQPIACDG